MTSRRTPRLPLELLRGFRLAARHLSFTRAARELFVTQSAISREIRTLENQLGRPLFRRIHRTLELTPLGEELYRGIDGALMQIDGVIDRLSGESIGLNVITTPALASLWVAPRLPRFNRLRPDVEVRIVTSNDRPDLARDQLDVGIRFVAAGDDAPDAEFLMTCSSFPVCSPALATASERALRVPADLAQHVRIDYESVRDGRQWSEWEFWFRQRRVPFVRPSSTLRFPQFDQCFPAAIDGAGVAIGVLPHVTEQLRARALCAPFGRKSIIERGRFYIVYGQDAGLRPEVSDFAGWLRTEIQRDADLFLLQPQTDDPVIEPAAQRARSKRASPAASVR